MNNFLSRHFLCSEIKQLFLFPFPPPKKNPNPMGWESNTWNLSRNFKTEASSHRGGGEPLFLPFFFPGIAGPAAAHVPGWRASNAMGQEHFLGANPILHQRPRAPLQGGLRSTAGEQPASGHSWYSALTEPKKKNPQKTPAAINISCGPGSRAPLWPPGHALGAPHTHLIRELPPSRSQWAGSSETWHLLRDRGMLGTAFPFPCLRGGPLPWGETGKAKAPGLGIVHPPRCQPPSWASRSPAKLQMSAPPGWHMHPPALSAPPKQQGPLRLVYTSSPSGRGLLRSDEARSCPWCKARDRWGSPSGEVRRGEVRRGG